MSLLTTLITCMGAIGSGISCKVEDAQFLNKPEYRMGNYFIYMDRKGMTYIRRNGSLVPVVVTSNELREARTGELLWCKMDADNEKLRKQSFDADSLIYPAYRKNIDGKCAIEKSTEKIIAKIERNFKGECRKWYWFDPYEKDKRKLEDMGMIVRDDHFEPVPADMCEPKDPGIVISDEEFENIKKCKRKFGCCISVYDNGYWC